MTGNLKVSNQANMGLQKPTTLNKQIIKAQLPISKLQRNDENIGGDCFIPSITSTINFRPVISSDVSYNSWLVRN